MTKQGGSPRIAAIFKAMESVMYALSTGDYYNAALMVKAMSSVMGVDIPRLPIDKRTYFPGINEQWRDYCEQNVQKVFKDWDKVLKAAARERSGFRLVRKGEDFDEEDGEE